MLRKFPEGFMEMTFRKVESCSRSDHYVKTELSVGR